MATDTLLHTFMCDQQRTQPRAPRGRMEAGPDHSPHWDVCTDGDFSSSSCPPFHFCLPVDPLALGTEKGCGTLIWAVCSIPKCLVVSVFYCYTTLVETHAYPQRAGSKTSELAGENARHPENRTQHCPHFKCEKT